MKHRLDKGQVEVVEDAVAEILRRKTPAQRVQMMFRCNRRMRSAIAGVVRSKHPDWSDAQVGIEVARRMARKHT